MRPKYNRPDLNAPRFRKNAASIVKAKFCNELRRTYPELKKYSDADIKRLIREFNTDVYKTVIEDRNGVELLSQLGCIFIGTCKSPKKLNPDVQKSYEYGVIVQHHNWDTDNHLAKIFYTNFGNKYNFKFHNFWKFEPHRDFSRSVPENYKKNWKKYVQAIDYIRISRVFRLYKNGDTKTEDE